MNQLQQEELLVRNPDIVGSERRKVQQLVGKDLEGVSEVKENSLGITSPNISFSFHITLSKARKNGGLLC